MGKETVNLTFGAEGLTLSAAQKEYIEQFEDSSYGIMLPAREKELLLVMPHSADCTEE